MKLYKIFDPNQNYPSVWTQDKFAAINEWEIYANDYCDEYEFGHVVELRSFDTLDIDSEEYHSMDEDVYLKELSKVENKYVLSGNDTLSHWLEVKI